MKTNFLKAIMMATAIIVAGANSAMAADSSAPKYEVTKVGPRKTATFNFGKTSQTQRQKIQKDLIKVKGIKAVSFKANTIYVTYNPNQISLKSVKSLTTKAYNKYKNSGMAPNSPQPGNNHPNTPNTPNTPITPNNLNTPNTPNTPNHSDNQKGGQPGGQGQKGGAARR